MDRLRVGLWTMLRHSSLRPDMPELARAIPEMGADTRRPMLTVDGPAPGFIANGGCYPNGHHQSRDLLLYG
jgi:adenine deaminase